MFIRVEEGYSMVQERSMETGKKRGPGRPAMYTTEEAKKAAAAMASWRYRRKVRKEKAARKNSNVPLTSKVIDLQSDLAKALASR